MPSQDNDAAGDFDVKVAPAASAPKAAQPKAGEPAKQVKNPAIAPVRLPEKAKSASDEKSVEIPKVDLPKGLKESLALLQATERIKPKSKAEQRKKDMCLDIVKAHVFKLQQGLPVIAMTANIIAGASANRESLQMERLQIRGRSDRDIEFLLEKVTELEAQVTALTEENEKIKTAK